MNNSIKEIEINTKCPIENKRDTKKENEDQTTPYDEFFKLKHQTSGILLHKPTNLSNTSTFQVNNEQIELELAEPSLEVTIINAVIDDSYRIDHDVTQIQNNETVLKFQIEETPFVRQTKESVFCNDEESSFLEQPCDLTRVNNLSETIIEPLDQTLNDKEFKGSEPVMNTKNEKSLLQESNTINNVTVLNETVIENQSKESLKPISVIKGITKKRRFDFQDVVKKFYNEQKKIP